MRTKWHVETAAEGFAAGQFARLGYDVSVQYGARQPEYDLIITSEAGDSLKISVKGTKEPGWGLCQSKIQRGKADYHNAIDKWLSGFKPRTYLCLAQFKRDKEDNKNKEVELEAMPRMYLASPKEVAKRLNAANGGRGSATLFEHLVRGPGAVGAGTVERIPDDWKLSSDRIEKLMARAVRGR